MAIALTGEVELPAARETVWAKLNDPDMLRSCIPGCEHLEKLSDTEFQAVAVTKIGPVKARWKGKVRLSDLDPPNSYRISGDGEGGIAGFARGTAAVSLVDNEAGTLLSYHVEAQIGGKIAQLGQRLVLGSSKKLADEFFKNFAAAVSTEAVTPGSGEADGPSPRIPSIEDSQMPVIQSDDGCPLHVEVVGPETAPVLMFSNSLGVDLSMWKHQIAPFARHFRVVSYDRRGHGRSGVAPGPYDMERLARDDLAIMDRLGLDRVNFCGLSIGGMVGQWLAANAPERIDRLVLSNTSCYYPLKDPWHERIKTVSEGGVGTIADTVLGMWFTKDFHAGEPKTIEHFRHMLVSTPVDGYIACAAAVRDMDHREILAKIAAPTLVIAGRHDNSTTIEAAEFIRSRIAGAQLTILDAAHISCVERPDAFNAEVLGFLTA